MNDLLRYYTQPNALTSHCASSFLGSFHFQLPGPCTTCRLLAVFHLLFTAGRAPWPSHLQYGVMVKTLQPEPPGQVQIMALPFNTCTVRTGN